MVIVSCPTTHSPTAAPSFRRRDYTHAYHLIRTSARASAYPSSSSVSSSSAYPYPSASSSSSAASSASSAVLLLVSPDVDALCATRILATLLTDDDIPHRIIPVDGYRGLLRILRQDVEHNPHVRSIVMLNLGSVLSIPTTVPLPPQCTLHVIDSHRPWNLENLFATTDINQRVWIWDDGEIETKLARSGGEKDAFERLEFDDDADSSSDDDGDDRSQDGSSDDDDDEDDDEEEDSDDEGKGAAAPGKGGSGSRKRKKSRAASSHSGTSDDDVNDDEEGSGSGGRADPKSAPRKRRKRHRSPRDADRPARLTTLERQRLRNILARYYHRGTGYGMSVAAMLYLLADKLGRGSRDGLWLAILGLTSQYLTASISSDTYDAYAAAYASEVRALEPTTTSAAAADAASSLPHSDPHSAGGEPDADDTAIRIHPAELRFTLYRHWSLESSMYHTAYVASKLNIWRQRGMAKLCGLMAKMGFSLSNCRQIFPHMALDLRRTLVERLQRIAPEYGLTELTYRGFTRGFGFRSEALSAADVVEGLSALLVAAHGVKIEVEVPGMGFVGASVAPGKADGAAATTGGAKASEMFMARRVWSLSSLPAAGVMATEAAAAGEPSDSQVDPSTVEAKMLWRKNFYEAYRALDSNATSVSLLRSSLLLAQALHRAIVQRGTGLIVNQAIRTLKNFRLAILKDGAELELFTNVDVLARLARWLVDALRDVVVEQERNRALAKRARRKSRVSRSGTGAATAEGGSEEEGDGEEVEVEVKPLPFLVAALDAERDIFVVLGQMGAPAFGETEANRFGLAFQRAARDSGARVRYDRFETAAVEVRRADLAAFVEAIALKA
ncbi:DNA replication initiation factor cdc45 [Thecaphora frezii]